MPGQVSVPAQTPPLAPDIPSVYQPSRVNLNVPDQATAPGGPFYDT